MKNKRVDQLIRCNLEDMMDCLKESYRFQQEGKLKEMQAKYLDAVSLFLNIKNLVFLEG